MHKDWSVQADVDGVATARGYAKYAFAEAGLDARESEILVLLVSELVTNAIVHAEPPVRLAIDVTAKRTRVEVSDAVALVPHVRQADRHAGGGRGLALVEHLATQWGTTLDDDGKAVWFEMRRRSARERGVGDGSFSDSSFSGDSFADGDTRGNDTTERNASLTAS